MRIKTLIQHRKQVAKKLSIAVYISSTLSLLTGILARWFVQKQHAYFRASSMWVALSVGRSLISLRTAQSSRLQIFFFNFSFIMLRHENNISLWHIEGSMKNWWLVHHCGSVRKSGNDLWKILTGLSVVSGTRRTEWRVRRELDILDGVPQFLRKSERVLMESG